MQQAGMYDDWIEVGTEGKDHELSGLEAMEDRLDVCRFTGQLIDEIREYLAGRTELEVC